MGYFGGSSLNPVLPPGQTPVGHTPIDSPHIQSLSGTGYNTPRTGYSTPRTGYSTPGHDISGILTPDLDLPLDIGAFDDLAVTDTFPPHTPTAPTPHTHHYTAHQPQMPPHQQSLHPQPAQGTTSCIICTIASCAFITALYVVVAFWKRSRFLISPTTTCIFLLFMYIPEQLSDIHELQCTLHCTQETIRTPITIAITHHPLP